MSINVCINCRVTKILALFRFDTLDHEAQHTFLGKVNAASLDRPLSRQKLKQNLDYMNRNKKPGIELSLSR